MDLNDMDLEDLMTCGKAQTGDLTFYKLVFNAFERLTSENARTDEIYRRSLVALVSGFLAIVKPEYLPQAVAAKNLLLKRIRF